MHLWQNMCPQEVRTKGRGPPSLELPQRLQWNQFMSSADEDLSWFTKYYTVDFRLNEVKYNFLALLCFLAEIKNEAKQVSSI